MAISFQHETCNQEDGCFLGFSMTEAEKKGYHIIGSTVEFYGRCSDCRGRR